MYATISTEYILPVYLYAQHRNGIHFYYTEWEAFQAQKACVASALPMRNITPTAYLDEYFL